MDRWSLEPSHFGRRGPQAGGRGLVQVRHQQRARRGHARLQHLRHRSGGSWGCRGLIEEAHRIDWFTDLRILKYTRVSLSVQNLSVQDTSVLNTSSMEKYHLLSDFLCLFWWVQNVNLGNPEHSMCSLVKKPCNIVVMIANKKESKIITVNYFLSLNSLIF